MSILVLSILLSYIIYKESNFYLNYIPNIIKKEIKEYLDDETFMNNIYTRKKYGKKKIEKKDKEIQCEIEKKDKEIQCEINDDLIIL
tara:strand:- start:340 stop:600 length:261 start_codon:yes stop_codon:yes gene_type:complete